MYLGCHLSASKGYAAMVETAYSIGANTFAFFTRNPRGSRARREDPADAQKAVQLLRAYDFGPLVACVLPSRRRAVTPLMCWRTICAAWRRCPAIFTIFTPAVIPAGARSRGSGKFLPLCAGQWSRAIL